MPNDRLKYDIYKVNWHKLGTSLLPVFLRKKRLLAFIKVLLFPLYSLHAEFARFKADMIYRQSHNSQVCYLEAVLNDEFDDLQRRIKIKGVEIRAAVRFYEPDEKKEVWFYEEQDNKPVYFYNSTYYGGDGADFTVLCPADILPATKREQETQLTRMNALINYYKLASKSHKIIYI